ncbi:hypothetical protein L1887_20479 [Cichorium endivia]|nr:hypothetical protein L1887_20479 [Cichorium endivia]
MPSELPRQDAGHDQRESVFSDDNRLPPPPPATAAGSGVLAARMSFPFAQMHSSKGCSGHGIPTTRYE